MRILPNHKAILRCVIGHLPGKVLHILSLLHRLLCTPFVSIAVYVCVNALKSEVSTITGSVQYIGDDVVS